MALWQYTFHVVCREDLESLAAQPILRDRDGLFDDSSFWQARRVKRDQFKPIESFLPRGVSWSNSIDLYGKEDVTCFNVSYNANDLVESVSFRVDFRERYEEVLSQILQFLWTNGFVVLDEELKQVPSETKAVIAIIMQSPQIRRYRELSSSNSKN